MSSLVSVQYFTKFLLGLLSLPFQTVLDKHGNKAVVPATIEKDQRILEFENSILSKDVTKMIFYLFPNYGNPNYTEILILGNETSVVKSSYNRKLPLILLIHGFISNYLTDFADTMKNAFLEAKFPANIVVVDWGNLSTPTGSTPYLYYNLAVENVPAVANRTADFISFLLKIKAVSSTFQIHIIGHSLGAHVSGLTGKRVIATIGTPVYRITGLDPAAPGFQGAPPAQKLGKNDAVFVDVHHTNQGVKGYHGLLGQVDFFPNGGGPFQPGCVNLTDFSDIFTSSCSHARAFFYYAKSIRNSTILACKCADQVDPDQSFGSVLSNRVYVDVACKSNCVDPIPFGQYCPPSARGIYYVEILTPDVLIYPKSTDLYPLF